MGSGLDLALFLLGRPRYIDQNFVVPTQALPAWVVPPTAVFFRLIGTPGAFYGISVRHKPTALALASGLT